MSYLLGVRCTKVTISSGFRRVIRAKPRGEEIPRASDEMKSSASAESDTKRLGWTPGELGRLRDCLRDTTRRWKGINIFVLWIARRKLKTKKKTDKDNSFLSLSQNF